MKLENEPGVEYKDNLKEADFARMRILVAKRKEQRRKIAEAEQAEKIKTTNRTQSGRKYTKLVYKAN